MAIYNFTNIVLANTTLEQFAAVNTDLTGGLYTILILVALFVIMMINLSYMSLSGSFLTSSFMCAVIGSLFWIAGLVPLYVMIVLLILPVIGVFLVMIVEE